MKIMKVATLILSAFIFASCTKCCTGGAGSKEQSASVFFIEPMHEAKLKSPVKVKFGVKGMSVRPALEDVNDRTSGHHHILIDSPSGFIEKGQAVPADARHIHYGKGQEEATIELTPGAHTLSMQFADGAHLSYGKEMATTISVTIVE